MATGGLPAPDADAGSVEDPFAHAPLFEEYLQLLSDHGSRLRVGNHDSMGSKDALLIIDMQNDFLPWNAKFNPNGGSFGVPEGNKCIDPIIRMIKQASDVGAHIVATRDYHPVDHVSFQPQGGHFPPHCVQGGEGSKLVDRISEAMADACNRDPEKVSVVFKGFHEDVDSFGGLPYQEGEIYPDAKQNRIIAKEPGVSTKAKFCPMGCEMAPWTGSIMLQQSALEVAMENREVHPDDLNCPPDIMAMHEKGKRNSKTLQDFLRGCDRIFVCGLALDFCCLDTCINARANGFDDVYLVLDSCRAAHIEKVGEFGTGFLSDPTKMLDKLEQAGVHPTFTVKVVGHAAIVVPKFLLQGSDEGDTIQFGDAPKCLVAGDSFPNPGKGFSVSEPLLKGGGKLEVGYLANQNKYKVSMVGDLADFETKFQWSNEGRCSPAAPIMSNWPDKPRGATKLCWAYPLIDENDHATNHLHFLNMSDSVELTFVIRGGYMLLSEDNKVLKVQLCVPGRNLEFDNAQQLPLECKNWLVEHKRFQDVTLPSLSKRGCKKFCWVHPNEMLGTVTAPPQGAFAYILAEGEVFFPLDRMSWD